MGAGFSESVVMGDRSAEPYGLFTDDPVDKVVVFVDLIFYFSVNYIVIICEVDVCAVDIAVRGMSSYHCQIRNFCCQP